MKAKDRSHKGKIFWHLWKTNLTTLINSGKNKANALI